MPFKSKSQERWMFANHPEMAKQWAADTPNQKALPDRVRSAEKHVTKKRHGSGPIGVRQYKRG